MFNKKILAASMAAAISTGMVAQSHAMRMQENNLGQVLLGPLYVAGSGITSDIIVVNTRTDAAVKAKIVFREGITSSEVLDFILYLSPGDVWRGTVAGESNAARMQSTDDSMTDSSGSWASDTNPVDQPFFDSEASGSNGYGHFEVIGVYSITTGSTDVPAPSTGGTTSVVVKQGMPKQDLKALFDNIADGDWNLGGSAYAASNDAVHLQMMGEVQFLNGSNALTNYEVPALGPDEYELGPVQNPHTGSSNYVISNPTYDAFVSQLSLIGQGFGPNGEDEINAIEIAIAATDTAFEYNTENSDITAPVVSFVTKYRHRGVDVDGCSGTNLWWGAPFQDTEIGEIIYTMTSFDNSENSEQIIEGQFSGGTDIPNALPIEVNVIAPGYFSTSGWAELRFAGNVRPGCNYAGAPALSATLKTKGASMLWTENGDRRNMYLYD